jgi:DNA primase
VAEELRRLIPDSVRGDAQKQSRAARDVRELLNPIEDAVLRYSYGKQAADRLGVPVEVFWQRGVQEAGPSVTTESAQLQGSQVQSLEERALQLLLLSGMEIPNPEDLPPEEIFLDEDCRNIFRSFSALYRQGDHSIPEAKQVLGNIKSGGSTVDRMARILLQGTVASSPGDLSRAFRSLIRRWQQQRQRELLVEINGAQRDGDGARLEALLKEKEVISSALHQPTPDPE